MSTAASSTTEPVHAEAENERSTGTREPRAATQTDSSDSGWLAPA